MAMLTDIAAYLRTHRQVTLTDLANRFHTTPDGMRGMLEHYQRKGRVAKHTYTGACSVGCGKCNGEDVEVYDWVGP
ncbi:MAG: FeoC-like transcriptional regulator [Rhodobacterales bacterium]|nr:FeoC-like transcriptional regulator [Rhodobacterales bacterium]